MNDFGDVLVETISEAIQGAVAKVLEEDPLLLREAIESGCREAFLNQVGFGESVQMSIVDGIKEASLAREEAK